MPPPGTTGLLLQVVTLMIIAFCPCLLGIKVVGFSEWWVDMHIVTKYGILTVEVADSGSRIGCLYQQPRYPISITSAMSYGPRWKTVGSNRRFPWRAATARGYRVSLWVGDGFVERARLLAAVGGIPRLVLYQQTGGISLRRAPTEEAQSFDSHINSHTPPYLQYSASSRVGKGGLGQDHSTVLNFILIVEWSNDQM